MRNGEKILADSVLHRPHLNNYLPTGDIKLGRTTTFKTLHFDHMMQSVNKYFKNLYLRTVNPVTYWSFIDS